MECSRGDVRAQGINAAGGFVIGDVFNLLRKGEVRISLQVASLHHHFLNVIAIRADELVAEAIEALAELGRAGSFVEFVRAGTETAIDAIEENDGLIGMSRGSDFRGGETASEIDPIIDVKSWMADAKLGGREILETFEDDLLYICRAITIGVFKVIKEWGAGDIDAAVPGHDAVWESESVSEDCAFVVFSIAIGVFEKDNVPDRWLTIAGADWVAAIFDDIHATFFVPGNGDGIDDHRFCCDEFDFKAGLGFEVFKGIFGR